MTPEEHVNGAGDEHLLDAIEDLIREEGPMTADEIAGRLGERGDAVVVIHPESVETYERNGIEVALVRGGSHRAVSARAVEERLATGFSGFRRAPNGEWNTNESYADEALYGVSD